MSANELHADNAEMIVKAANQFYSPTAGRAEAETAEATDATSVHGGER